MSVLGHSRIQELLSEPEAEERLFVTPLLDSRQITESSIDVRLGTDFLVTKRGSLPSVDPKFHANPEQVLSRHRNNLREAFFLHQNELVLASTLEYFRLPLSVAGAVTSRSSWGRVGLVIATATHIHPGYKGAITLELLNLGEVPIVLYPGLLVAQIIFHETSGALEYEGRFTGTTSAESSQLASKLKDIEFWIPGEPSS